MSSDRLQEQAVEVLQMLGLKEYEAKSFVALSRMPHGTAKKISETSDVPRTRVYDAVRVLEAKGLVEVQHSNPQQFRAVGLEEAVNSLQDQYDSHVETLRTALERIEPVEDTDEELSQEVWALSGTESMANRTQELIAEADEEIVLVVGADELLTDELLDSLDEASNEVNVIVGALTESAQEKIRETVPKARVFVSGLEWLHGQGLDEETAVGRLLLVDRGTILLSSIETDTTKERGVFGRGFGNGLVVIARRLMATGLVPAEDPDPA